MFYLQGVNRTLETIALATKPFLNNQNDDAYSQVKEAYFKFTKNLQPDIPNPQNFHGLHLVDDVELSKKLATFFIEDSMLNDKDQIKHVNPNDIEDTELWRKKTSVNW